MAGLPAATAAAASGDSAASAVHSGGARSISASPHAARGTRRIYHSTDPVLVEHMIFRLRAEVGFGVTG